jgi:hypothetical protein
MSKNEEVVPQEAEVTPRDRFVLTITCSHQGNSTFGIEVSEEVPATEIAAHTSALTSHLLQDPNLSILPEEE